MMRGSVAFAAVMFLCACGDAPEERTTTPGTNVTNPVAAIDLFSNITSQSGVQFIHATGTNYFMPDQIGSGIAIFDFDQDGRLDLYFLQNVENTNSARNQLFQQQTNGTFKDVSASSGLEGSSRGMSAIAGDINNDGTPDLVTTAYGATRVFQNIGNEFRDVTTSSGVDNPRWGVPASFLDFDRDGWLDLVVGNYVDYDPTQLCTDRQGRPEFCAPAAFPPTPTRLWRNVTKEKGAEPRFEDWTVRSGIHQHPGVALGIICADFTCDGWTDIFCSDDGRPNRLFVNQHNGTFSEEALRRGLAYNAMGSTAANMGVALGDLTGDALPDLFITHLTEEFHSFYQQDKPGLFNDIIGPSGMQQQGWRGTGFGTVAADFNHDGALDIALVNGLIRRSGLPQSPLLPGVDSWWSRYAQRPQIFLQRNSKFEDASLQNPTFCGQAAVGRSLAMGDLNNDGAPDLVVGNVGGPAQLDRNVAPNRGHWLKLRLIAPEWGNRDAIGAEVRLRAGEKVWWNIAQPATSYCVSNDPTLHFGLGTFTKADHAEVLWPDGATETFEIGAVDRTIVLQKGSGTRK